MKYLSAIVVVALLLLPVPAAAQVTPAITTATPTSVNWEQLQQGTDITVYGQGFGAGWNEGFSAQDGTTACHVGPALGAWSYGTGYAALNWSDSEVTLLISCPAGPGTTVSLQYAAPGGAVSNAVDIPVTAGVDGVMLTPPVSTANTGTTATVTASVYGADAGHPGLPLLVAVASPSGQAMLSEGSASAQLATGPGGALEIGVTDPVAETVTVYVGYASPAPACDCNAPSNYVTASATVVFLPVLPQVPPQMILNPLACPTGTTGPYFPYCQVP